MKIEKLILRNFASIKNAQDANEITINLNESNNKICLIIGENGKGKTSILSMLSPFADLGNLDVRNTQSLILDGKEGYKEIHIRKDNDLYIIKHIYTPHEGKSHSVKSYIELNGNELNINGNVTSFKEYVKQELQIEPEYLKLIRLGNNVTNMINLSETERKNFMSKILDEIGIFLDYYKLVNEKMKRIKDAMNHSINKLNKIGVSDRIILENEIDNLSSSIKELKERYDDINSKIAIYKHDIDNIDDVENIRENYQKTSKKYLKMKELLDKKTIDHDLSYYNSELEKISNKISETIHNITIDEELIRVNLNTMDSLKNNIDTLKVERSKEINSEKEILSMSNQLDDLRKTINKEEETLDGFKPLFTLKELEEFIMFLKTKSQIIDSTYDFGKQVVSKVIDLMRNNKSVPSYINSHLASIDDERSDFNSLFFARLQTRFTFNDNTVTSCTNECEAKKLYNEIKMMIENVDTESKNKKDSSFYKSMDMAYQNILSVINSFSIYSDFIDRLPDDYKKYFTLKTLYDNISKLKKIYPEEAFNNLLSIVTEYDNYINHLKKYDEDEATLNKFISISNLGYIEKELNEKSKEYESINDTYVSLCNELSSLKEELYDYNKSLEIIGEIKETLEKYDEVKALYEKYDSEYTLYKENNDKIKELSLSLHATKVKLDDFESRFNKVTMDLNEFDSLTKEIKKYNTVYDEINLVKRALSSKEGIPLRYTLNYLGNVESITNELLDIAYCGDKYIDKFDISPTSFCIPFFNKGVRLPDVKYASQGEMSFLSIALSFALASQTLSKYNIMLLDEIDGPLDSENREKFIRILENQIDRIDSEQNFLITHNDMFASYPIDIIDLSEHRTREYPLANYISIERR